MTKRKSIIENIIDIQKIADKDCYCDEEEQFAAECDGCDIHKASSILNEIGSIIDNHLREINE